MVGLTAFFYLHYSKEKLKAAMGHSNIMVSLTYLRGLDVAELKEEDMPMILKNPPKRRVMFSPFTKHY